MFDCSDNFAPFLPISQRIPPGGKSFPHVENSVENRRNGADSTVIKFFSGKTCQSPQSSTIIDFAIREHAFVFQRVAEKLIRTYYHKSI
jgi:hypothetical protein